MRTAFVLAGGGSLGAVEAGMLEALFEAGVEPDLVVGSSAGAINAAFLAGAPDLDGVRGLQEVWRRLRRGDVFPLSPLAGLLGFLSLRNHLVDPGPLAALIGRHLGYRHLEEAPLPIHVVATDIGTGLEAVLSSGPAITALLASTAIPGVFPPVAWQGRHLSDGCIANNTPISVAAGLGVERVIVLPAGYACEMHEPPASALGLALHGLSLLIARQLAVDVARFAPALALRVVPPLCPLATQPFDFSQAAALIERAATAARAWLAAGGLDREGLPPELPPHAHDGAGCAPA
jgi:NTE family protein